MDRDSKSLKAKYTRYVNALREADPTATPKSYEQFVTALEAAFQADEIKVTDAIKAAAKKAGFELKSHTATKGKYKGQEATYLVGDPLRFTGWMRTTKESVQEQVNRAKKVVEMGAVLGIK